MTLAADRYVEAQILEDFLARCEQAARRASVEFLSGRAGIAPEYALCRNPRCRSLLDGHAPHVKCLSGLHLRARCQFRVPLEFLPPAARIVDDGGDREVLLAGQRRGEGEAIGAAVVLGNDALIQSLLLPDGLEAFVGEHLPTRRGWSDLRPEFGCSRLGFEVRRDGPAAGLFCCFTAEMDA